MKNESYKKKAQADRGATRRRTNLFPVSPRRFSPRQLSSVILGLVRGSGCVFNLGPTDAEFFHSGS
jgi:hypothetical protein